MSAPTIYNRFDPAAGQESIDFLPDRTLQSRELNDLQSMQAHRVRALGDALFAEGAIVRGAGCIVDAATGAATLEGGALYLHGTVRGVLPAALQVPTAGIAHVGVYVRTVSVTELQDPGLRNPAVGTKGYQEAGAWRTQVHLVWGVKGDGQPGEFYGLWEVEDGIVKPREAAARLNPIAQALASYDRDSAGGNYIVSGLAVTMLPDGADGAQMYSVAAGTARVNGYPIRLPAARTVRITTAPDLQVVDSEPHLSTTDGLQHITFDRWPVVGVPEVRVQARKTVTLVHGGFAGVADPLPDAAVIQIELVKQGGTTFAQGTAWLFNAGQIDWSPGGAEPAPGSSYEVTYQHITQATPQNLTTRGYDVAGALPGSLVQTTYTFALRRIDRLVLTADGTITAVRGVPDPWLPSPPAAPDSTLALASITQTWDAARSIRGDGVRLVPMPVLEAYDTRLDDMRAQMAELRLAVAIAGRYSGIQRGQFADPLDDDTIRDAGQPQTAVTTGGTLQLRNAMGAHQVAPADGVRTMDHTIEPLLAQPLITGTMRINPTDMPSTRPTVLQLQPPVDRWSEKIYVNTDDSPGHYNPENRVALVQQMLRRIYGSGKGSMRQIEVVVQVQGFNGGENIAAITFGGHSVTPQPLAGGTLAASPQGAASARFTVPPDMPEGTVQVIVTGTNGTRAESSYTAQCQRLYWGYANMGTGFTYFEDIEI